MPPSRPTLKDQTPHGVSESRSVSAAHQASQGPEDPGRSRCR
ncbi:MAG: hypothetical protein QXL85_08660 [Candidatus Bathyarchaeia archaeon]